MRFDTSGFAKLGAKLKLTEQEMAEAFRKVIPNFSSQADNVIKGVLIKAAAQAGSEAFPLAYIEPMLEAAERLIITSPTQLTIEFDELGTVDELVAGFHYGAKIDGGGQVELPYGGEALKNDTQERYIAWQKIFHGETWHGLDYSGSWDETIQARLETWGDKAPQWLLLQYGQTTFDPIILPYPVIEDITFELEAIFESMLRLEINLIASRFNQS